jgi:hypothetical protein
MTRGRGSDDQQERCNIFRGRSFDLATGARRAWMAAGAGRRPCVLGVREINKQKEGAWATGLIPFDATTKNGKRDPGVKA